MREERVVEEAVGSDREAVAWHKMLQYKLKLQNHGGTRTESRG